MKKKKIGEGATLGLPGRSPISVLLYPKFSYLQSSDAIHITNVGMITMAGITPPPPRQWAPHKKGEVATLGITGSSPIILLLYPKCT